MDLFNPADRRPVHFVGIGGAGMSALALIARRRGVVVSGCDIDVSGTADLAALGATIFEGHDSAHLDDVRALVVTAAMPANHPEVLRARALGVPVVPRKEALGALVAGASVVAIAGTHGKTTTTVMTTEALAAAGLAPTGIAGGRVSAWGGNALISEAMLEASAFDRELFVVEADEYDQAFLTLYPTVAVVNNVEPDHLECYGSVDALETAFAEFASRADVAIINADDVAAARVAEAAATRAADTESIGGRRPLRVQRFGFAPDADIRITDVVQSAAGTQATVRWAGGRTVELRLVVPGVHNLRNAVAALAVVVALGGSPEQGAAALAAFGGVGRRFERLGEFGGIAIVDDYAHHPSELAATLAAARQAFPERRLVAVFQPHLYSRTALHGEAMGQALAAADVAFVADVYAAREAPIPGVTGRLVADAARAAGADARFEASRPVIARAVYDALRPGDVVLTLGAGDITRVGPELARWLSAE